jgi:FkbM family methyltransferase
MLQEIRRTLKSEGMTVHPIKTRAHYLKGFGFKPDVVFDVGVCEGTPWLYRSFPNARFVLIDPQAQCELSVQASKLLPTFEFHAVALGEEAGEAKLSVPYSEAKPELAMASLLKRSGRMAEHFVEVETQTVPVARLDEIAGAYPGRVGLKIDTEGYEAQVLRGGPETLLRCDFVILELSVTSRFEGLSPPSEVVRLLADAGLEMRDVLSVAAGQGKRAQPRYMDVLFTRWVS